MKQSHLPKWCSTAERVGRQDLSVCMRIVSIACFRPFCLVGNVSLGPIGAPKGRRAKCKLSPLSDFFFQAIGGVSTKRRAMSFGYVVDMDKISKRFLAERDPTTGSGITGLQSSEFPSLKRLFFSVSRRECTAN